MIIQLIAGVLSNEHSCCTSVRGCEDVRVSFGNSFYFVCHLIVVHDTCCVDGLVHVFHGNVCQNTNMFERQGLIVSDLISVVLKS